MKPETIFDHSPTRGEIEDIFHLNMELDTICHGFTLVPMPVDEYRSGSVVKDLLLFDIGLLYFYRGEYKKASKYFFKAPRLYGKFRDVLLFRGG